MAVNPLLAALLGGQNDAEKFATPGINPSAPTPAGTGISGKADDFLGSPSGNFLINLLAQQGFSTTPQSPFGAIGRAAQQTQQQGQERQRSNLEEQLLRARIGLTERQAETGGQRIVQSAQTLGNGNIGFLNAFTGKVVDTGAKAGGKGQVIDMPGIGQVIYDPTTSTLTQANPEDVIRIAEGDRAGVIEAAKQNAVTEAIPGQVEARISSTELAKQRISVPEDIAEDEPLIEQGEEFIRQLESGQLETGFFRGQVPAFKTEEQLFEAYSGQQLLKQISSVTLGALSKGEMDFLQTTVTNRTNTPEANIDIIRRKNDILLNAAKRGRAKIGDTSDDIIDFNDLP